MYFRETGYECEDLTLLGEPIVSLKAGTFLNSQVLRRLNINSKTATIN
jgi:hypothetical protein